MRKAYTPYIISSLVDSYIFIAFIRKIKWRSRRRSLSQRHAFSGVYRLQDLLSKKKSLTDFLGTWLFPHLPSLFQHPTSKIKRSSGRHDTLSHLKTPPFIWQRGHATALPGRGRLFFRPEPPSWLPKNCPFEPRWVLLGGSTPLRTPRSAPEGGFSSLTQRPEAFCQHEPRRLIDVPERHEASSSSPPDESAPEPRQKEKRHQRFNQQPQCRHNEPGRRRPSEVCLPSRGPSNVISSTA